MRPKGEEGGTSGRLSSSLIDEGWPQGKTELAFPDTRFRMKKLGWAIAFNPDQNLMGFLKSIVWVTARLVKILSRKITLTSNTPAHGRDSR